MTPSQLARFRVLASSLERGKTFETEEAIAQLLKCNRGCAHNVLTKARGEGCITNEFRQLSTLALTPYGREVAGLGSESTPKAKRASAPPEATAPAETPVPAATPGTVTAQELRALLDAPELVTLVRRVLAQPWGPGLLEALTLGPVRVAAPVAAPKVARVKRAAADLEVEVEDDPPPKPRAKPGQRRDGPYRVLDVDEEPLGEFRTRAEALAYLETEDDADTVVDGNGKTIERKTEGTDDDD